MKSAKKVRLILIILVALPGYSQAQPIAVSLPDSAFALPGASIDIPIFVADITGSDVFSYDAAVLFDSSVLQATGASETGTLSEPFGEPVVSIVSGLITASASGSTPLSGSGTLVNLQFDVIGDPGQSTQLQFVVFRFDGGAPVVDTDDGFFTVAFPPEPEITVTPQELDFGEVATDSTAEQTVTITNAGTDVLDITAIVVAGADAEQFDLDPPAIPFMLSPQASETVNLQFIPSTPGPTNATLEISSNDPDTPQVIVPLRGTGIAIGEPDIALVQSTLEFGGVTVNTTAQQPLTILNEGTRELMIESFDFSGPDANEFIAKIPHLPFEIIPGDSQLVMVGFRPRSAGIKTADALILSNDPDEQMLAVPVSGQGIDLPDVTVSFLSPDNGTTLCGDLAEVTARVQIRGGLPPIELTCEINGMTAAVSQDSTFSATIPLSADSNFVVAECQVRDTLGNEASAADTLLLIRTQRPICDVEIISPADSFTVAADSVEIVARHTIMAGTPPFDTVCEINGVRATQMDSIFKAQVPLTLRENLVAVTCVTADSCGNETTCTDSIRVFRGTPICEVAIIRPTDDALVCESPLEVEAVLRIRNAAFPIDAACDINGIAAQVSDSLISATVPIDRGENEIIATCHIADADSRTTVCMDSIEVFLDTFKPNCRFDMENGEIVGTIFDRHSGIQNIEPVEIKNGTLTVDPFAPGAKNVDFRITPIDKNRGISFSIDVTDVCGNKFNCDPIFLTLSSSTAPEALSFQFPSRERYLQVENFGLSEITIELNGGIFQLRVNPDRAAPFTTYVMPQRGTLTLDLSPQLDSGGNRMNITVADANHGYAELLLSDQAETVDHILEIKDIPTDFALAQNYPNPFNAGTAIRFDIPASSGDRVRTRLLVYNLKGELVRTLLDQDQSPGGYTVVWDGTDQDGDPVSSGIYVYRIIAGNFIHSRRMLLLK